MTRNHRRFRNRISLADRVLIEQLESRRLFSISVAHAPAPQYFIDYPFPQMVTLATLKDLPSGFTYSQIQASFTWDNNPAVLDGWINPTSDSTADIYVSSYPGHEFLPDSPGVHTAHMTVVETDASGNQTTLHFNVRAIGGSNSSNGRTITPTTGQEFNGVIGTVQDVPPSNAGSLQVTPINSGGQFTLLTDNTQRTGDLVLFNIEWGDGTTSLPAFVKNENGTYDVIGDHTYTNPGFYQITLTRFTQYDHSGPGVHNDIAASWGIDLESSAFVTGDPVAPPAQPSGPGSFQAAPAHPSNSFAIPNPALILSAKTEISADDSPAINLTNHAISPALTPDTQSTPNSSPGPQATPSYHFEDQSLADESTSDLTANWLKINTLDMPLT